MKKLILIIIFLSGLGLCCYPMFNRVTNDFEANQSIKQFQIIIKDIRESKLESHENSSDINLNQLLFEFQNYNKKLYEEKQVHLSDPFSYEQASFDLKKYGFDENMIGYISIEKLDLKLPIYLGATHENLEKGAVHLSETSIPIGGNHTNAVIAAHNGWYGKVLFRHLDKLQLGDEIQVTNFWDTLTYEVVKNEIVQPEDINKVLIQENRELITLMTCYPYGKNSQRYLVYLERVEKG